MLLKSAIKTAKVGSLSGKNFCTIKTARRWQFYGHFQILLKSAIKTAKVGSLLTKSVTLLKSAIKTAKVCSLSDKDFWASKTAIRWQFYGHFLTLLKSAIKTAKVSSLLTKCPALLKSAIKTAKVCSLSDDSFSAIKTANGRQFVRHLCNLVFFLLKSAIKTAKVCSLLTNPPKVLKSAIKTAKVWQFVYVATKLPPCGSLYPRKKVWIKLPRSAVLMALFKTALYWQVSPSVLGKEQ